VAGAAPQTPELKVEELNLKAVATSAHHGDMHDVCRCWPVFGQWLLHALCEDLPVLVFQ
jgi:hypothetical protein